MNEIKCPKCGQAFTIDEASYADILKQVRDESFHEELEKRERASADLLRSQQKNELQKLESEKNERIKELEAKIDMFIELTERLLSWLQEEGIDYSHILREYEKDHNGETVKTAFS